jgi:major membrane immunogen (membrane-anchored lipoprotein)
MGFEVARYEKYRDKDGNIVNILVAVRVWDDAGNAVYHEYWLKRGEQKGEENEVAKVMADENNIVPILEKVVAEAMKRLEDEVANKPKPPVIASIAQCRNLSNRVRPQKVTEYLRQLKEAKADDAGQSRRQDLHFVG